MEWTTIINSFISLCATGGVVYLIVDKLFARKETKAKIKHQEVENKKETIEYGVSMVSIYNEIDKIVESKTKPIQEKLDHALTRIDDLESNWCCFREDCEFRIRSRRHMQKVKALTDEEKCILKNKSNG